ncbi:uncharacterized protein LOC111296505 [Durio zibethinus]|uniref:Uncharacterized protein LOC111296505 n=1 Tax=Durio zibethinus TaxID=66656 RepID=A0A6P5Z1Z5_DURZI|nr:uncharacterized protein LOC111296505 [Durio zibethinus]
MYKQALMGDAWMREAQEASKLMEDIETRVNNMNPTLKHQENRLLDSAARSKLLEAGIKLDRLESLLRNPPSKPVLTKEDLDYRWKMLSDMQMRTKTLALSLYAVPTSSRPGYLTPGNTKATNTTVNDHKQDETKTLSSTEDPEELVKPLISNDGTTQSQVQMKQCGSSTSLSLLWKVFWIFGQRKHQMMQFLSSGAILNIMLLFNPNSQAS